MTPYYASSVWGKFDFAVIGILVFVEIVTILRAVFLAAYLYSGNKADDVFMQVSDDKKNSSVPECATVTQPSNEENTPFQEDLARFLHVLLNSMHILEYWVLARSVRKYQGIFTKWDEQFWKRLLRLSLIRMIKRWRLSLFVVLSMIAFGLSALVHPVLGIVDRKSEGVAAVGYRILTVIAHLFTIKIRLAFVFAVIVVRVIWFDLKNEVFSKKNDIPVTLDGVNVSTDERKAARIYYRAYQEYQQRSQRVKPLLCIFDEWFVIQWIHYLFRSVVTFWVLYLPLALEDKEPRSKLHIVSLYLLGFYLSSAFIIPYLCGAKAHRMHVKYRGRLLSRMDQEAASDDGPVRSGANAKVVKTRPITMEPVLQSAGDSVLVSGDTKDVEMGETATELVSLPENRGGDKTRTSMLVVNYINRTPLKTVDKCGFVPRVRMVGIAIPIGNPGYIVGILVTMFALIGTVFLY